MNNQVIWIVLKKLRIPFLVLLVTFSISIIGLMLIPTIDNNGHIYHLNFFDAFYFVSYMATTIGFGEGPYDFTYPQKLWVTFSIYLTVIGWFYAIGTIVALIQDESLKKAINVGKFIKQVKALKEDFFIILGYNRITKEIINNSSYRFVVIDKIEEKIDELHLEDFEPYVPSIVGDATQEIILRYAGIEFNNCKGIISLFENDSKNMQIATVCRLLNPNLDLIVKATSKSQEDYYKSIGVKYTQNPFKIISQRIYLNITKPYIWLLELWAFGHKLNFEKDDFLPKGKYIVCGYGRMGQALEKGLKLANVEYEILNVKIDEYKEKKKTVIFGDEEDKQLLESLDIKNSDAIIAATNNDLFNLTVINKSKQLNPDIYTIARENSLDDITIFQTAKMNRIYVLEKILAEYTITNISKPLVNTFIKEIRQKENEWGEVIVNMLKTIAGDEPVYYEITINEENAYALMKRIKKGEKITFGDIRKSRSNRDELLKIVYLILKRDDNITLMPLPDEEIKENDKILIASNSENIEDFEYILNNMYELDYVLDKE
jgi:voltage-gated potassium channel